MFTRKRVTYGLIAIVIILTLLRPLYNYITGYYQTIEFWSSHNLEYNRSIFDVWYHIVYDTANIFFILSPITIIFLVSVNSNADNRRRMKPHFLKVFIRPICLMLIYSFIALLIAIILPTKGILNIELYDSSTIIINFLVSHINLILFTVFATCFYIISEQNIKSKSIATLVAVISIVAVIYGMSIIGEILPLPDVEWLRPYHFIVHSLVQIDTDKVMYVEFLYMLIWVLFMAGLTYLTLKYGESNQEETF